VYLAKAKFGAIVVIERQHGLKGLVEGGTEVDARLNRRLLQTIFFPGSALHDLAVVIRGEKIAAAGVQLPMADPGDMPDPSLGARHRAAVGLTRESDALVVVVSEETGAIRIAERGRLSSPMTGDELTEALASRLRARSEREGSGDEDRAQAALQAELADTDGVTKSEDSSRGVVSEREGGAGSGGSRRSESGSAGDVRAVGGGVGVSGKAGGKRAGRLS
jgi:diadenylate cyclase